MSQPLLFDNYPVNDKIKREKYKKGKKVHRKRENKCKKGKKCIAKGRKVHKMEKSASQKRKNA